MPDFNSIAGGMFGWAKGMGSTLFTTLKYFLYVSPLLVIIIVLFVRTRNKNIYRYKVRVFKTRENNKVKEVNYVGGYINRVNSAPFFKVKTGRWSSFDLSETPKLEYMDEEDRVYYKQIDVNTFIQMRRELPNLKNKVIYTPVESDVKYGAILSIQRIKDVLRTEPTWKRLMPYFGLIVLAIVFIVAYSLLLNKCQGK